MNNEKDAEEMKRKEVGTEYAESGEVLEECGETEGHLCLTIQAENKLEMIYGSLDGYLSTSF